MTLTETHVSIETTRMSALNKLFAVVLSLSLSAVASADDLLGSVNQAILRSIEWQQRWYGEAFGADCVQRRAREGTSLIVQLPSPATSYAAYVERTNVLYSGRIWPGKVTAEPSAGDLHTCGPGEIREQVRFREYQGPISRGPFVWRSADAENRRLVLPESSRLIASLVMRSLDAYFTREGKTLPTHLRLAHYALHDPDLLVLDEEHGEPYLLDFPPLELVDERTLLPVYNGSIFIGFDDQSARAERMRRHLIEQVKANSERLMPIR
jgi:hypothetical protein